LEASLSEAVFLISISSAKCFVHGIFLQLIETQFALDLNQLRTSMLDHHFTKLACPLLC
jgi:hypothetical protein